MNEELEQDNLEQDNEHSTTTQELVVDDAVIIGDNGKDNEEHDIHVANEEQQEQAEQDNIEAVDKDILIWCHCNF